LAYIGPVSVEARAPVCCFAPVPNLTRFEALSFHDPLPVGFGGFTWLVADGFAGGAILALLIRDPGVRARNLPHFARRPSLSALLSCL